MLCVQLTYYAGRCIVRQVTLDDSGAQIWKDPSSSLLRSCHCCRGYCKWTDGIAGVTRDSLAWLDSTYTFTITQRIDGVLLACSRSLRYRVLAVQRSAFEIASRCQMTAAIAMLTIVNNPLACDILAPLLTQTNDALLMARDNKVTQ